MKTSIFLCRDLLNGFFICFSVSLHWHNFSILPWFFTKNLYYNYFKSIHFIVIAFLFTSPLLVLYLLSCVTFKKSATHKVDETIFGNLEILLQKVIHPTLIVCYLLCGDYNRLNSSRRLIFLTVAEVKFEKVLSYSEILRDFFSKGAWSSLKYRQNLQILQNHIFFSPVLC